MPYKYLKSPYEHIITIRHVLLYFISLIKDSCQLSLQGLVVVIIAPTDHALYNLQSYYCQRAKHNHDQLDEMTGLRNGSLLLDNFKEDDIEERPGGDALHHSHPEAHGVLLCGGGVKHSHAGPGSDDRGEGEGGDVEDYQAPVDLTENAFWKIFQWIVL